MLFKLFKQNTVKPGRIDLKFGNDQDYKSEQTSVKSDAKGRIGLSVSGKQSRWQLQIISAQQQTTAHYLFYNRLVFWTCSLKLTLPLLFCRFIAVSIPLNYNRKHVDHRQLVLLSATWLLALAVASPVIFGINNVPNRDPSECKLEDNNYVVYSSVCSFFIPCPIMVLLYFGVFRGLQRWEEARKVKLRSSIEACRKLQHAAVATALPPLTGTIPGPLPMPLPRIIERDLAQSRLDDTDDYMQQEIPYPRQYRENSVPTVTFSQQLHRKKRAKINNRERKAMKVLPVVVGECACAPSPPIRSSQDSYGNSTTNHYCTAQSHTFQTSCFH